VTGEAHRDPRTRLRALEVNRIGEGADDSLSEPATGVGILPPRSLVPDRDHQGCVAHSASNLKVEAIRVAHRVCRRLGDRELDIGDHIAPYLRLQAPFAYLSPCLGDAGRLARKSELEAGRACCVRCARHCAACARHLKRLNDWRPVEPQHRGGDSRPLSE
jgi:hypothetical protein